MMDAVIKYLPNPLELAKNKHSKYFEDELNGNNSFIINSYKSIKSLYGINNFRRVF